MENWHTSLRQKSPAFSAINGFINNLNSYRSGKFRLFHFTRNDLHVYKVQYEKYERNNLLWWGN